MSVTVHDPVRVEVSLLAGNPDNPKKPMSSRQRGGLKESLSSFGMAASINVAAEPGGRFLILDGNTRVEDLREAGVSHVWCVVHADMAHDAPGSAARREEFVLAFDRVKKAFDKRKTEERLEALVGLGRDRSKLDSLLASRPKSDKDEKEKKDPPDTDRTAKVKAAIDGAKGRAAASDHLVIYGPKEDVQEIRDLLHSLRESASLSSTLTRLLREAGTRLAADDETFLTALAATMARLV